MTTSGLDHWENKDTLSDWHGGSTGIGGRVEETANMGRNRPTRMSPVLHRLC